MSRVYILQLSVIRDEYKAARVALEHLYRFWPDVLSEIEAFPDAIGLRRHHVKQAGDDLESTYFIRLFSTFEGILRYHLQWNRIRTPRDARPLIDRVATYTRISDSQLIADVQDVRLYRNDLVHIKAKPTVTGIDYQTASGTLNKFLNWLPDPP